MITEFKIKYVQNSKLSSSSIDKIIELKKEYWNYSDESHEKWIKENLNECDHHLWIETSEGDILAYLDIVNVRIEFDKSFEDVLGIGNVCVTKKISGTGVGLLLMEICNYYIKNQKKRGMLLCKNKHTDFYQKSGWKPFEGKVILVGNEYSETVMFNKLKQEKLIQIENNF